jgi:hypothetical protein
LLTHFLGRPSKPCPVSVSALQDVQSQIRRWCRARSQCL